MLATIQVSPYVQVQGLIVRVLPGGRVAITLSGREYVGAPLTAPLRAIEQA